MRPQIRIQRLPPSRNTRNAYPWNTYINKNLRSKRERNCVLNALRHAATMFVDQISTEIAVIPLCRPQMAILDFEKGQSAVFHVKMRGYGSFTHEVREGTKKQPLRTTMQQGEYGTRPAPRLGLSALNKGMPERILTLQSIMEVTLNPTNSQTVAIRANIRAMKYTMNDHFHGRLPVNISHSNSRVVRNSHLWKGTVNIAKGIVCRKLKRTCRCH